MQSTSLQAHQDIKKSLGDRQKTVLEAISRHENITNKELSRYLCWDVNSVTPRVFELREFDRVKEDCKRICKVSGRKVIAWAVNNNYGKIQSEFNF